MKNIFDRVKKYRIFLVITLLIMCICILFITSFIKINKNGYLSRKKQNIEIRDNKETIYSLFYNFPESEKIYYTIENLYSELSIGPTIYQIDILAELTDENYNNFLKQIQSTKIGDIEKLDIKFNPNNIKYCWKEVKDVNILKTRNGEDASVTEIYLDENNKTIYVIAKGGN